MFLLKSSALSGLQLFTSVYSVYTYILEGIIAGTIIIIMNHL